MKVSVLVPAFNSQNYVGRCLRSLLHQTLPHTDYEIIVVDDGSTDLTSYALSQFQDPKHSVVKVLTHSENKGLPAALNTALAHAAGEYIIRVDSDDFVNENLLTILSCYLDMNTASHAVASDYLELDNDENVLGRKSACEDFIACSIMYRAASAQIIGGYDESFRRHEDLDYRIRFESLYSIDYLAIPLYRYRLHQNNITNDSQLMTYYANLLLEKHGIRAERYLDRK